MGEDKQTKEIVEIPANQVGELRDPKTEMEFAQRACKVLMEKVNSKKKKVIIQGKQYLEFGDWQTIARFFGLTVGSEDTQEIIRDGKLQGFLAKAYIYDKNGIKVSSAEAACMRDEKNWETKPEFQLRSMAQTRAGAKALRNAVGWVAEVAGYSSTPVEEMDGVARDKQTPPPPPPPKVDPVKQQQIKIMKHLFELGYNETDLQKPNMLNNTVKALTQVDCHKINYEEIINRLDALVKEKKEAK